VKWIKNSGLRSEGDKGPPDNKRKLLMTLDINSLKKGLVESRVWKSVVRHGYPDTETNRALAIMSNLFLHLHPVKVKRHALKFNYTFGLGGLSLLLFIIEAVTGAFLMFYYVPSVERAFFDMKDLRFAVYFGVLMRNMHRWAAHGMVAVVFLHMCRVFYTAAYKTPREFNWVLGVFLFVVTLAFSYTGYLLPWDQLAYWGVTVGTNIAGSVPLIGKTIKFLLLGGNITGQNALLRFYVLHCFVLPMVVVVMMGIHFWRIRKDGGISGPQVETSGQESTQEVFPPQPEKKYALMSVMKGKSLLIDKEPENTESTFPYLVSKELAFTIISLVVLLIVSYCFNAPLEEMANPEKTPSPAKAPWYFLWIQEMISWASPFWSGVVIPGLIMLALVVLPYLDRDPRGVGVWFAPERKRIVTIFTIAVISVVLLILIGEYCRGPGWEWYWPWEHWTPH
jgi:quinol-cytochrome oxidoreductase complex cytochrome b subunit